MKNLWKGAVALGLLGFLVAASGPGCVANESSIFIRRAAAPSCDLITVDSPELLTGVLDTRYSCTYIETLVVGNQLVRRGDDNKLQTETSRVEVKSVDVEVLDAGYQSLGGGVGQFTEAAAGFVDPATNTTPGYGLTAVQLVDGATAQYLDKNKVTDIIARVTLHGRTLGGQDLTAAPWDFPIKVCNGCLCTEPADDSCINPTAAPKTQCLIAQDFAFDCRSLGGKVNCAQKGLCGSYF